MRSSPFAALDRRLTRAPGAARVSFLLARDFAHRGLWGGPIPENSLAGARAAIAGGFGIECDVRLSRDGTVIVFHDAATDRLTGHPGRIATLSAPEIAALRLGGGAEPVPALSDLIGLIAGRVPLLIEIKTDALAETAPLCLAVRRVLEGYRGPVAVMGFNPEVGHWFATHAPRIVRGLVMTEHRDSRPRAIRDAIARRLAVRRARPDFLAYDVRFLPSALPATLKAVGLPVLSWTVRDRADRATAAAHADRPIFERPRDRGERGGMTGITARVAPGVASIPAEDWDACAGAGNPFLSHAFLSALEDSGSAVAQAGWQPVPIVVDGADGKPAGILPAYAKSHSQGEYVFDHGWADAWESAGGSYYPKLQIAVPFTPVPGPRLLLRDPAAGPALIAAAEAMVAEHDLSSAHATFLTEEQLPLFEAAGWMIRTGSQFHWHNEGYASFADFLAALSSRKRKAIVKERAGAQAAVEIRTLTGAEIGETEWDAFWGFYQDTGSRKWGRPYLTRPFFSMLGERMGDKVLLMLAYRDGRPVAGALNLIGGDTLYGRYWGCTEEIPFLHFELCYYQAIEAAILRGLKRVEAGAQGEHKLARGYRPVPTWSAHYIPHPGFRRAVAEFLAQESRAMEEQIEWLGQMAPFRKDG